MPIARIVTRSPERAASLRKTLVAAGYHVEVVRPEDAQRGVADIEYDIDEMPEYAGQPEVPAEREFIFAPQWRALKARFGKSEKPADRPAPTIESSVSYARLEEDLNQPAKGPSLLARMQAMRAPLSEKLNGARQEFDQKRQRLAQQMAERRAAADEARRLREAEVAAKREADRVAAERARAEAALRLQEQKAREAQRLAEVQAQMEIRRKEQERLGAEAEQRARLEAERLRAAMAARETTVASSMNAPAVNLPVERRRSLREIFSAALQDFRNWREKYASTHFTDTRSYALRQYTPAIAGIALAFFIGWAIAIGGARKTAASNPSEKVPQATPAAMPAALAAPVAAKPSAVPQKATATKQRPRVRRFRQSSEDDEVVWKNADHGGDDDVTVIHHYPGKSSLAHSGKKNGVKTISDLEQD